MGQYDTTFGGKMMHMNHCGPNVRVEEPNLAKGHINAFEVVTTNVREVYVFKFVVFSLAGCSRKRKLKRGRG